jgi:voltage-gated potassium channel
MKDSFDKYVYRYLLAAAFLALVIGTFFYHFVEHLSWLDAYYFSVVTLTTIGYGDIVPHTAVGKVFTTLYAIFGIGILTTFISYSMQRRSVKIAERRGKRSNSKKLNA